MTRQISERDLADEVRCVQLIDSARAAGLEPIKFSHIHAMAYLAEALSPVWGVESTTGEVLKREGLPFFPRLQTSLDRLIWRGVVEVDDFSYIKDAREKWVLEATCHLSLDRSQEILRRLRLFADETERGDLYLEIALGLAHSDNITELFLTDASYSDPSVSVDRLIDFSPDTSLNLSARVADEFSRLAVSGGGLGSGERVALYIAHLRRTATRGA